MENARVGKHLARVSLTQGYDADVAVVGAGPAGAAAAAHLAHKGVSVLLIDQHAFPRDKTCGDFVGPVAVAELDQLGVTARPDFRRSNRILRAGVPLSGRLLIEQGLPAIKPFPPVGMVVPRERLDHWIVQAAVGSGARLLERRRLVSFSSDHSGVSLQTEGPSSKRALRVRLLIGADGSTSMVARVVRGPLSRLDRIIAIRAYVEGVTGPPDRADLFFSHASFPGYCWLFPTAAGAANLGIGMLLETVPQTEDHLRSLLAHHVHHDQALADRLRNARVVGKIVGWPLATFNHRLPMGSERVLLCGDAGSLINPINGEGIQYALQSGRWAADAIASALATGSPASALPEYRRHVDAELGYDMRLSRTIAQLIRSRALTPVFLQALQVIVARAAVDPAYAARTGGLLAGLVPAREVVSSRVVLGTIAQAAQFMRAVIREEIRGGPTIWGASGVEMMRLGFSVVHDGASNPRQFALWASGLGREVADLAAASALKARARPYT